MNNMRKQGNGPGARSKTPNEEENLRVFANSVGDFIRYWGFRRIHGQLWAQIYLSKENLSGAELTARLRVSKALVSPALKELERHGLIRTSYDGNKTKRYSAEPDVLAVIKDVLLSRESKLIEKAARSLSGLEEVHRKKGAADSMLQEQRMEEIRQMVDLSQVLITFLIHQMNARSVAGWASTTGAG
jgi:DNA-binding transcriptional regulator GbsR (MarR family)